MPNPQRPAPTRTPPMKPPSAPPPPPPTSQPPPPPHRREGPPPPPMQLPHGKVSLCNDNPNDMCIYVYAFILTRCKDDITSYSLKIQCICTYRTYILCNIIIK